MRSSTVHFKAFNIFLILSLLAACGGSGGSSDDDTQEVEQLLACLLFPLYCVYPVSKADGPEPMLYPDPAVFSEDAVGVVSAAQDDQGNVYSAGHVPGSPDAAGANSGQDAVVLKHGPSWNLLWTRRFGSADNESAEQVMVNNDGSVLVTIVKLRSMEGDAGGTAWDTYRIHLSGNGETLDAWQVTEPEGK
jgi:hypothetical protein